MLPHPTVPVRQEQPWEKLRAQHLLPLLYRQNRPPAMAETLAPAVLAEQHYCVQLRQLRESTRGNNVPRPASADQLSRCFQAEQFVSEMRSCHLSLSQGKPCDKFTYIEWANTTLVSGCSPTSFFFRSCLHESNFVRYITIHCRAWWDWLSNLQPTVALHLSATFALRPKAHLYQKAADGISTSQLSYHNHIAVITTNSLPLYS